MAIEDIKSMLKFRGLAEGFKQTPLRKFWGKLVDYVPAYEDRFKTTRVTFKFTDVEVIETDVPYPWPTAEISVKFSDRKGSAWGILAESALPWLADDEEVNNLVGKKQLWYIAVEAFGTNKETGEPMTAEVWHIEKVEGASRQVTAEDSLSRALDLLDGKTESEFNQKVFADPIVKMDMALVNSIVNMTFLPAQAELKKISKDATGVWHKVK